MDAAISMTDKYSGNADYQQIYQDLNTSLTSGNGPGSHGDGSSETGHVCL